MRSASGGRSVVRESVSVEDQQIKALETKLGLSGSGANGKKKLQRCVS